MIDQISADYSERSPATAAYFERQQAASKTIAGPLQAIDREIKARYHGTPVGASESIFAPLAPALGLRLLTPSGSSTRSRREPSRRLPRRRRPISQINTHRIKVWVYNSQNATPDVQRLNDAAKSRRDPHHDRHRDADARRRQLPGLAVARAREPAGALARATGR